MVITFRMRRIRREMCNGHGRLCVCVCMCVCMSVSRRMPILLHGPRCNLGEWLGVPFSCALWADLQSVHRFRCYDSIVPNAKCQRVHVLVLCLVLICVQSFDLKASAAMLNFASSDTARPRRYGIESCIFLRAGFSDYSTLVVQVEQSVGCVCLSVSGQ